MPFDGVPNQHGLASLGLARDSLSRPGGWCQGGESINGAQCAMRALATITTTRYGTMRTGVYGRPCLTAMARSPPTTIPLAARKPTSSPSSTGRLNSPAHGEPESTPGARLRQPLHAPEFL
jgi:hypothetical protein